MSDQASEKDHQRTTYGAPAIWSWSNAPAKSRNVQRSWASGGQTGDYITIF